jgi:hypothetical protein
MRNALLKKLLPAALAAVCFTVAATMERASQPTGVAKGYLVSASPTSGNTGLVQALGEFRVVAANMLWQKVDHYHDRYIEEGGDWTRNASILPMLRQITILDPHFDKAYELMGGTILPKTGRIAEGRAVLAEGIRNNPDDWELYREMAMLEAVIAKKPAAALPYARIGLRKADDDFDRNIMRLLCKTLEEQVKSNSATATPRA